MMGKLLALSNSVLRLVRHGCIVRLSKCQNSSSSVIRPVFLNAIKQGYGDQTAVVDSLGRHTYEELIGLSTALAQRILAVAPRDAKAERKGSGVVLNGERVALLCPNNISFIISQFAAWMSGCTVVPLCKVHPQSELDYIVGDSQSSVVIATREFADRANNLAEKNNLRVLILNEEALVTRRSRTSPELRPLSQDAPVTVQDMVTASNCSWKDSQLIDKATLTQKWSQIHWKNRKALIVYTSGTTGPPKGVVTTFAGLQAQVSMMLEAWHWSAQDVVLHVLPLHHVHGVVNALACPLWCGATCVMMPQFDVDKVWDRLLDDSEPRINLFMAVPTMYAKLLEGFESRFKGQKVRAFIKAKLRDRIRLMISGSAALPQPVLKHWEAITGHRLLERYGMTEVGMALSNPLHGVRVSGAVGNPFPTVDVRIVAGNGEVCVSGNSKGSKVTPGSEVTEGELQVRGPGVFREYWNRPVDTAEAFTDDGWFKTGDTASYQDGVYRILGRTSLDIIKSGGYKISALDVEHHLLAHDRIAECAVVGVPDVTWGQRVAAVVVLKDDAQLSLSSSPLAPSPSPSPSLSLSSSSSLSPSLSPSSSPSLSSSSSPSLSSHPKLTLPELRAWAREHMAPYTIPTELRVLDAIPRNAMGKVSKTQLLRDVFELE